MPDQSSLAKKLVGLLEGISGWVLYGLFRFLPTHWCSSLGGKIGRFYGKQRRIVTSRIQKNICWIMPSISDDDRSKLSKSILNNVGRCYFETMIADRLLANGQVEIDRPEHVLKNFSEGKSVIFVTVHIANLGDLMCATLSNLLFREFNYLYGASPTRPLQNKLLLNLSSQVRKDYLLGTPGHSSNPNFKTARDYRRTLVKPRSFVIFHIDEAYDQQVHFPTFGRPIEPRGNLTKAIKLAAGTGALIQPVFMTRESNGPRFKVSWLPVCRVEIDGATLNQASLLRYSQQLNELFEPRVFENLVDWAQIAFLRQNDQ